MHKLIVLFREGVKKKLSFNLRHTPPPYALWGTKKKIAFHFFVICISFEPALSLGVNLREVICRLKVGVSIKVVIWVTS